MADRLSPLSYDSGLHSISAPSSPKKLFEGTTAAEDEGPPAKRPKKEDDARVPASTESSEETLSSDDPPRPTKEQCQSFCSSMPSTSRLEQPLLITTAIEKSRGSLSPRVSLPSPEKKESRPGSRIERPKEDKKEEEEKEAEHVQARERKSYIQEKPACAWDECTIVFDDINILYDHVMETHIMPIVNREEDQEGELECLWEDCEMSIVRGDWVKKTRWLTEHYKARHSKGAQAVKCVIEQCTFRCTTFGKLDDHVRKVHLETKEGEQKGAKKTKEKAKPKKEDDNDSQPPYFPILQNEFPWNDYYVQIIVERQQKRREMNGQCEWALKKRPGKGAAHRKSRAPLVGEFVPKLPKPKPVPCAPDPEIKERMKLTLEDLFPGWNYKSPFSTSITNSLAPSKPAPPVEKAPNPPSPSPSPQKSESSLSTVRTPLDFLLPRLSFLSSSSSSSTTDSPASLSDPQIELDCSKCVDHLVTSLC